MPVICGKSCLTICFQLHILIGVGIYLWSRWHSYFITILCSLVQENLNDTTLNFITISHILCCTTQATVCSCLPQDFQFLPLECLNVCVCMEPCDELASHSRCNPASCHVFLRSSVILIRIKIWVNIWMNEWLYHGHGTISLLTS